MEFTARQIAELLKGKVDGDPEIVVSSLSKIDEGLPGTMTFLANPVYTHHVYTTKAAIVIVNEDFAPIQSFACTLIRVEKCLRFLCKGHGNIPGPAIRQKRNFSLCFHFQKCQDRRRCLYRGICFSWRECRDRQPGSDFSSNFHWR